MATRRTTAKAATKTTLKPTPLTSTLRDSWTTESRATVVGGKTVFVTTTKKATSKGKGKTLNKGAAIAIGVVVALVVLTIIAILLYHQFRKRQPKTGTKMAHIETPPSPEEKLEQGPSTNETPPVLRAGPYVVTPLERGEEANSWLAEVPPVSSAAPVAQWPPPPDVVAAWEAPVVHPGPPVGHEEVGGAPRNAPV